MATPENVSANSTPLIDEWIAAAGEPAVTDEINETRRRIADGSLPSFDNPADLSAFLARSRRQSA